jgi:hypothetical protein
MSYRVVLSCPRSGCRRAHHRQCRHPTVRYIFLVCVSLTLPLLLWHDSGSPGPQDRSRADHVCLPPSPPSPRDCSHSSLQIALMDTQDSFRSLDEMESFVTDPAVESMTIAAQPSFSNDSLSEESLVSPPPQPFSLSMPLGADPRRRSQSQPADLASYIPTPDAHLIPSSMKIVSPLKDISRSKRLFSLSAATTTSVTDLSLPLTIGSTLSSSSSLCLS